MTGPRSRARPRGGPVASALLAVAALLILLAATGVVVARDPGTPTTVATAVERFRGSSGDGQADPASPPTDDAADPAATGTPPAAGPATSPPSPGGASPPASAPAAAPTAEATVAPSSPSGGAATAPTPAPSGGAASPTPTPAPDRPEEGVYRYATSGWESIDAFGGARHEYPPETAATVRHSDCGYRWRWQPLEERFDEFDVCRTDRGQRMRAIAMLHEFFGRRDQRTFACEPDATTAVRDSRPGDRWTWSCSDGAATITTTIRVVDVAPRSVGGATVEAVHVVMEGRVSGDMRGTRHADAWFARDTGLELAADVRTDIELDIDVGTTRYREEVTRTLLDLRPER